MDFADREIEETSKERENLFLDVHKNFWAGEDGEHSGH
jgi:hypothetical protein